MQVGVIKVHDPTVAPTRKTCPIITRHSKQGTASHAVQHTGVTVTDERAIRRVTTELAHHSAADLSDFYPRGHIRVHHRDGGTACNSEKTPCISKSNHRSRSQWVTALHRVVQPTVWSQVAKPGQPPVLDWQRAPSISAVVLRHHLNRAVTVAVNVSRYHHRHVSEGVTRASERHHIAGYRRYSLRTIGYLHQSAAIDSSVVPDHVDTIGWIRTHVIDLRHKPLRQLHALPLILTPAGPAPRHVRRTCHPGPGTARFDPQVTSAKWVGVRARPSLQPCKTIPTTRIAVTGPPGRWIDCCGFDRHSGRVQRWRNDADHRKDQRA